MKLYEVEVGEVFILEYNNKKEILMKIETSLNEIEYIALKSSNRRLLNKSWSLKPDDQEVIILGKLRFNDSGDPFLTRE